MIPLVSALMTCYNREKYIAEAIESVLASTYSNLELIIVDDCSTDSTLSIASSFCERDGRIRLFKNENNLGQFPNRNKAASYAKGEFLMNADSDDKMLSDGIERCVDAMVSFPQSSFGMVSTERGINPFVLDPKVAIRKHFFQKSFLNMGPGGTIIRRSFFNEVGGYPTSYGVPGDMYFNLKAACYTPVVLLPFDFLIYRRHEGQEINNHFSYLINNYTYLRDALVKLPLQLEKSQIEWLAKKNKRRFVVNIVKHLIEKRNIKKSIHAIRMAHFSLRDALSGIFH